MDELLIRVEHELAIVTLNRPFRKNALSIQLMNGLADFLLGCTQKGVVLTGAGDVFSSGVDTSMVPQEMGPAEEALGRLSSTIRDFPKVVVAALNGPCLGGAVEIAVACDIRVGSPTAFFEIPAVRLGVLYRPEGLELLTRKLPQETLARLFLLNERIFAQEAVSAGLMSQVSDDVLATAMSLFSTEGLDAEVVAATKEQLVAMSRGATDHNRYLQQREKFARRMLEEQ